MIFYKTSRKGIGYGEFESEVRFEKNSRCVSRCQLADFQEYMIFFYKTSLKVIRCKKFEFEVGFENEARFEKNWMCFSRYHLTDFSD